MNFHSTARTVHAAFDVPLSQTDIDAAVSKNEALNFSVHDYLLLMKGALTLLSVVVTFM